MEIIEELNGTILNSTDTFKTIQLVPGDTPQLFLVDTSDGSTNIGFSKRTYLGLFKQCHTFWHSLSEKDYEILVKTSTEEELRQLYLLTSGYLITTNENHTLIYIHELVVYQINKNLGKAQNLGQYPDVKLTYPFIRSEFDLISTFLHSRLKRINKSSSLWLLMKKLSIILIFNEIMDGNPADELFFLMIDRTLRGCEIHFANYYACNYLRWVINVLRYLEIHNYNTKHLMKYLSDKLTLLCKGNLADVSLWSLLGTSSNVETNAYSIEEYNYLIHVINTLSNNQFNLHMLDTTSVLEYEALDQASMIVWLLSVECTVYTPFASMVRPNHLDILEEGIVRVRQEISELEVPLQSKTSLLQVLERVQKKVRSDGIELGR